MCIGRDQMYRVSMCHDVLNLRNSFKILELWFYTMRSEEFMGYVWCSYFHLGNYTIFNKEIKEVSEKKVLSSEDSIL
jgi:hypothetical protein